MKINDINTQMYLNRLNQTQRAEQIDRKDVNTTTRKDKIELSNVSKEMARYVEQAKNSNIEETDRVNQIKAQLEQGTYQVSSQQIARAMMNRLGDK